MSVEDAFPPQGFRLTVASDTATRGIYEISTDNGRLISVYDTVRGVYTIADIAVVPERRRRGIGKELLRVAERHASMAGARLLVAAIISRESLDAFSGVFGEYVEVTSQGNYLPDGVDRVIGDQTVAMLYKPLT